MSELTPQQQAVLEKRRKQSQNVKPRGQAGPHDSAAPLDPVPLKVMLGQGERVTLGDAEWEIAPLLLKDHAAFRELLRPFHMALLVALATSADGDTGEYDLSEMSLRLTAMYQAGIVAKSAPEDGGAEASLPDFSVDVCAYFVYTLGLDGVTEEAEATMREFTRLVLSRKHATVTTEQIAEWLDLETFLTLVRITFRVNGGINKRLFS